MQTATNARLHREYPVAAAYSPDGLVEMLTVGIGYENLPESLVGDNPHYVGHTQRIKLVENVVKQ